MRIPLMHPSLADLSAFDAGELDRAARARTADHLRDCAACQESLRFVRSLNAPAAVEAPPAGEALLDRILASRAQGERVILPAASASAVPTRPSNAGRLGAVAATLVVVFGLARAFAPTEALAVAERSELTINPAAPTAGAAFAVRYLPPPTLFPGAKTLTLRARYRTPDNVAYNVPAAHVRRLGTLARGADGAFTGRFTLPDSAVFAVIAVESSDSARVDDNDGPGWEVLVAGADGRPLFTALDQRSNDMMGRSWEEAYASIRRATELYPEVIEGWTTREFFERELFSGAEGDSIARTRTATIERLVAQAKRAPTLGYRSIEGIYYRAYRISNAPGATKADSTEWDYWWTRIQREYPKHGQIAQRLALWMDAKAIGNAAALDSLDRLYAALQPLQGAGHNLISRAQQLADAAGDAPRARLWMARSLIGVPDSAARMATFLSAAPAFRDEGMRALRTLLAAGTRGGAPSVAPVRALSKNAEAYRRRVEDARRTMFAALGRALLAEGASRSALDTLRLAAEGGWDPALFRELARSYATAGDSMASLAMNARLVVDPRTSEVRRDSLGRVGERRLGSTAWTERTNQARREMQERVLERSVVRPLLGTALVRSRDGVDHPLATLTGGQPALVIFWSRHCGYALEAIPEISALLARLKSDGTKVIVVVDEEPSAELDRALADRKIDWPLHYDVGRRLASAMRNFGTPSYFALDRAGRIRFTGADQVPDLIGQIDALRAEGR